MKLRLLFGLLLFSLVSLARAVSMPLVDLDGNVTDVDQYRGKWVIVNYWATWCPPCIVEMPELQAFHDDHAEVDAVVLGINVEKVDTQRLRNFLDDYFITYPVFLGGPMRHSQLGTIPGLPTTFLIDPEGSVVARQVGPVTGDMIERFIENYPVVDTSSR